MAFIPQVFNLAPEALIASSIATGGTAVVIVTGPCNGGFVTNPYNAAAQGIAAAENLYVDMVAAPGATDSAGNGTTVILQAGQNFTWPGPAPGVNIYVNAATTGHKFSGEVW